MIRLLIALTILSGTSIVALNRSTGQEEMPKRTTQSTTSGSSKSEAKKSYKLGVKHGLAKEYREAADAFMVAIRLQPDYADAYYGLGHAYFDMGQWKEAIQALEQAVALNPKDREAYAMMGDAYNRWRRETKNVTKAGSEEAAGERVALSMPTETSSTHSSTRYKVDSNGLTNLYRVGIGDVLKVRLGNTSDQVYTVSPDGLLDHPILRQPLNVAGLTTTEISERIESDLKKLTINEHTQDRKDTDEVAVEVGEYNSHRILVSGLVKDPGTKILRREAIPLYVVMADAQPSLEAKRAILISKDSNERVTVDLSDQNAMNVLVHPGDVITVEQAPEQFFYIGGEVKAPGEKSFRTGLTLTQAILFAGGVTEKAKTVELSRERAHRLLAMQQYKLKEINSGKLPDPEIQPGDRITVLD